MNALDINTQKPSHGYIREDGLIYDASCDKYISTPGLTKIKTRIVWVKSSYSSAFKSGVWAVKTNSRQEYSFLKLHWCCEPDFKIVAGINVDVIISEENGEYVIWFMKLSEPDFHDDLARCMNENSVPATAVKKLHEVFADGYAPILSENPALLYEMPEFKRMRAATKDKIIDAIEKHMRAPNFKKAMLQAGMDKADIQKTVKREQLENNAHLLVVKGLLSFEMADKIAQSPAGQKIRPFNPDSIERVQAIIAHVMNSASKEGHCGWPTDKLLERVRDQYGMPGELAEQALRKLATNPRFARDGKHLFLSSAVEAEAKLQAFLFWQAYQSSNVFAAPSRADFDKAVAGLPIELNKKQIAACWTALTNNVSIITGGPGTGKTTCLKLLKAALPLAKFIGTAIGAKAAANLEKSAGIPAMNSCRLLSKTPTQKTPKPDRMRGFDILIIDETSMINCFALIELIETVERAGIKKFIFVGDEAQIQPIGIGEPFRNMISLNLCPVTKLEHVYRTDASGGIAVLCADVRAGKFFNGENHYGTQIETIQCEPHLTQKLVVKVHELLRERGIKPEDICVLSLHKKSETGMEEINFAIRKSLGLTSPAIGDLIMCLKNSLEDVSGDRTCVLNGWTGKITGICKNEMEISFPDFLDEPLHFALGEYGSLPDGFGFAYAGTVHKYQGSEAPYVIAVISNSFMMTRALIYTAFSRAKVKLFIIGELDLIPGVLAKKMPHRITWLSTQNADEEIPISEDIGADPAELPKDAEAPEGGD